MLGSFAVGRFQHDTFAGISREQVWFLKLRAWGTSSGRRGGTARGNALRPRNKNHSGLRRHVVISSSSSLFSDCNPTVNDASAR